MVSNVGSSKGSQHFDKITSIVTKEVSELMKCEIVDEEAQMSVLMELHSILTAGYLMEVSIYKRMPNLKNMSTCDGAPFLIIETAKRQQTIDPETTLCVDLNFKQQYKLGRPTHVYSEFFGGLPSVFVGSISLLHSTVDIASDFMKQSFTEKDMFIPPWRTSSCIKTSYDFTTNKSIYKVPVSVQSSSSDSESSSD
eukprot:TRINITY_DN3400_c0_g1_i1.p1 TRINITY_DN3400_c0_g1~~TRINITY_DN3400_c0_g1_i1.p1  ORF type:complete len:196 (+),score=36.13 TRINITY_DN3400_c0_g1_i1:62-649(+)